MLESIKNIFTAGGIAKTGAGMVEAAFFTDQERAAFLLEYMKASAPMNISRRFIAWMISILWGLAFVVGGLLFFIDRALCKDWSAYMGENINTPFSIIMGFYFLAHVVSRGKA